MEVRVLASAVAPTIWEKCLLGGVGVGVAVMVGDRVGTGIGVVRGLEESLRGERVNFEKMV